MIEFIPQKLDEKLIKEISSKPPVSTVLNSTALSKKEAIACLLILELGIFEKATYGYVGNVGIKSNIPNEYKKYVNTSNDLDVAVLNISSLVNVKNIKKYKIVYRIERRQELLSHRYEFVYTPFDIYRVDIPSFQIGDTEYREIDVFTKETGIGPIKIDKEDFEKCEKIEYFNTLNINAIIASHINPQAFNKERIKRVFFASMSPHFDIEYTKQKLEGSIDVIKKVGIPLTEYKNGFEIVYKEFSSIKKRFEKKVGGEKNLENFNKLMNVLKSLYETTPTVLTF